MLDPTNLLCSFRGGSDLFYVTFDNNVKFAILHKLGFFLSLFKISGTVCATICQTEVRLHLSPGWSGSFMFLLG